jgi:Na+-driven multidrug efflux pump
MPVFGLNNGLIPVLAYNYGAKCKRRIDEALRFSLLLAFCVMCCGTLIFEFFPRQLLLLFNASEDMMGIGSVAMRIIALNFPLAAVGIILGSVFQAFSRSYYSLIISLCRQLIILIPAAWLIARITGNVSMVWWSFPLSEVISAVLSIFFFRKVYSDVTSSF